jgi:signal transduction histidine kinase/CheY-like chemotaxis protein/HPt (histidine-containing phosphotransfer) domain-containing protein
MTSPARRNRVRWTVGRMLTAGFAVALVALGVVGAAAYDRIGALMQAQQPLNQSHRVLGGIGKLGDLVNATDRTQRGYLNDHNDASLQLYRDTADLLTRTLGMMQHDTADDPQQQQLIGQIRPLLVAATGPQVVAGVAREDRFNRINDLVNAMHDRENTLLEEHLRAIDESARRTRLLIVAVSAGTALFVAAAGRWITKRITSAAHEVTDAAGRVIEGDLTRPAEVTGPAELAQMARAVNSSMTAMAGARDEALAATAAKSAFLASMSHEIRTPMNAVIGGTSLLNDSPLDAEQRELVGIVRGSAESLLVIINDILDFSKIEAGELTLDEQPVNLRGLLDDAINLVALTADAKGLRLTVEMTRDCPITVIGDETRLRQILVNLLGNAVKFTDRGGVAVRVSALDGGDGRIRLRMAVRDTGIGIERDQVDRLFIAFSQVEASTRGRAGTGLGLVISRRLAEAMGGTIDVTSTPGTGSTFTIEASVGLGDDSTGPPPRTPSRRRRSDVPSLHVLLAEDNPINQRVAELMLTRRGHVVDIVDNGADAVQAVHDVTYDLVLMDVQMPVMDGLSATERIREDPPAHGPPRIVALTANATVDDQAAGRRAGMDDFLAKPIQEADLDLVLATAAGRADTGRRLTAPAETRAPTEDDDIRASVATIAGADFANQIRLADILLAFARRLPSVLAELDNAVVDGDHERVDRLAHGLKGSAGTLGAHRLAAACARLEAYAQKRDAPGLAGGLRDLHERAEVAGRAVTTVSQELVASAA